MLKTLLSAFEKREGLLGLSDSNCCRLFNARGDGIDGLTLDRYGDYILIQFYDEALAESVNGKMELIGTAREAIMKALERLPVNIRGVLAKNRITVKGNQDFIDLRRSMLLDGELPQGDYTVRQNNILAGADLLEGQSTGIFLDMREIRSGLEPLYGEKNFSGMLNLFSYTALFSVHALKNGVPRAVNVDLSRTVLRRAMNNYRLNDIAVDDRDFIYGDALNWIKRLIKRGETYSIVVIDPPTFARGKKNSFSVRTDYENAIRSLEALAPGGYVLSAINSRFISKKQYISFHPAQWKLVTFSNESSDFPAGGEPYLKAGLWSLK